MKTKTEEKLTCPHEKECIPSLLVRAKLKPTGHLMQLEVFILDLLAGLLHASDEDVDKDTMTIAYAMGKYFHDNASEKVWEAVIESLLKKHILSIANEGQRSTSLFKSPIRIYSIEVEAYDGDFDLDEETQLFEIVNQQAGKIDTLPAKEHLCKSKDCPIWSESQREHAKALLEEEICDAERTGLAKTYEVVSMTVVAVAPWIVSKDKDQAMDGTNG